ncbi:hypothetical protein PV326_001030, partial [Microctonus aethiopoides]
LKRTTFYYLLNILKADMDNFDEFGHPPIAPEKQLLGKATAWRTVLKVVNALGKFRNYFITWPTPLKAQETANILEARYGFPGVIGMVDGTHIPAYVNHEILLPDEVGDVGPLDTTNESKAA